MTPLTKEQQEIALRVAKETALCHGDTEPQTDYDDELKAFIIDFASRFLAAQPKAEPVAEIVIASNGYVDYADVFWLNGIANLPEVGSKLYTFPPDHLAEIGRLTKELVQYKNVPTHPVVMRDKQIAELRLSLASAQASLAELEKAASEPVGEIAHIPGGSYEGSSIPAAPYDLMQFYDAMPKAGTKLYLHSPQAIPEGWKLVPVEPTEEMVQAWLDNYEGYIQTVYKAMLAAAPSPEGEKG